MSRHSVLSLGLLTSLIYFRRNPSSLLCVHLLQSGKPTQRRAAAAKAGAGGRPAGGSNNILQFYTDDSPGLQVGPTTVLVASLSFVGIVVLLHIWGKFRM